jgi:hypothetical protein
MSNSTARFIFYLSSFIFLFIILPLLFAFLPLPLNPYLDFQVLYHADLGLTQGIALYDHAGQVDMIARLANVPREQVIVLPFPYPPWYALSTIFLAFPPPEVSVRLWFGLNLAMLLLSAWLLTDGWKPAPRLISFPIAILFFPVLGSLAVGQYIFPVLLGASLLTFALRRESFALTALAAALLTFKPHLGGPIVLAALIHLYLLRTDFSRRALKAILLTGIFLFLLGFLADPVWPVHYIQSLLGFRDIPGVDSCGLCASLPVALVALVTGETAIGPALPLGLAIFALLLTALFLLRRDLFRAPETLVPLATLLTLLADPYLLNYDFTLLLIPLFALAASVRRADWFWLALAYFLPLALLGLLGREGSLYLSISALLLLSLQLTRARSIDVSPRPS